MSSPPSNPFLQNTNLAPAIVFCCLYACVVVFMAFVIIKERFATIAYRYLTAFAIIRVIAYILRAVISQTQYDIEANVIVAGIFLNSGFLAIVYVLSSLVSTLSRYLEFQPHPEISQWSTNLSYKLVGRWLPLLITAAAACSAAGAILLGTASSQSDVDTATALRKAGAFIYLGILTMSGGMLFIHMLEMRRAMNYTASMTQQQLSAWTILTRIIMIELPVPILLIIRTIYLILTLFITSNVNFLTDDGFYPLYATLEFIATCWLAWPYLLQEFETICREGTTVAQSSSAESTIDNQSHQLEAQPTSTSTSTPNSNQAVAPARPIVLPGLIGKVISKIVSATS